MVQKRRLNNKIYYVKKKQFPACFLFFCKCCSNAHLDKLLKSGGMTGPKLIGSLLRLVMFNTFINYIDNGIESTFDKFVDDTKVQQKEWMLSRGI